MAPPYRVAEQLTIELLSKVTLPPPLTNIPPPRAPVDAFTIELRAVIVRLLLEFTVRAPPLVLE
jgi:hypothetical protein